MDSVKAKQCKYEIKFKWGKKLDNVVTSNVSYVLNDLNNIRKVYKYYYQGMLRFTINF